MISLENENIIVTFNAKGAELTGITSKQTGLDYMWKGDPEYWGKFSPVLFPIVGGLKNDTYIFEDKEYHLPRHGFARDNMFDVAQISDGELLFTLSANADTLKVYPFQFKLRLRYQLSGNSLSCTYEVSNEGDQALLFSIGGHPAFAAPLTAETGYEDYFVRFSDDASVTYHKIADNLISNETETIQLEEGKLNLKHELFYDDALVFKSLKSNILQLRNTKNEHGLDFSFPEFPYFGIWAAKDADFVCLEPWCGIADGVEHNQQLGDKEGITSLSPAEVWKRTWTVTVY
jgi:galactose mutarotase-like enzyme